MIIETPPASFGPQEYNSYGLFQWTNTYKDLLQIRIYLVSYLSSTYKNIEVASKNTVCIKKKKNNIKLKRKYT